MLAICFTDMPPQFHATSFSSHFCQQVVLLLLRVCSCFILRAEGEFPCFPITSRTFCHVQQSATALSYGHEETSTPQTNGISESGYHRTGQGRTAQDRHTTHPFLHRQADTEATFLNKRRVDVLVLTHASKRWRLDEAKATAKTEGRNPWDNAL